jgi:hypothetical protein
LAEHDDLARARKPVDAELGTDSVRDRAGDLDLKAGLGRVLTRERRIRGIRTQPNPSSLTAAARGRDQERRDRSRERGQSVSPNTTMMSL